MVRIRPAALPVQGPDSDRRQRARRPAGKRAAPAPRIACGSTSPAARGPTRPRGTRRPYPAGARRRGANRRTATTPREASPLTIRDPVHGDVELDEVERRVLDTPEVQRLRGIRQLGTAYLVYPGALHTRFDHSLGTCAVAHRILALLRARGERVTPRHERIVGVAALVHDVTHVPFGHTLEDENGLFPRHDRGHRLPALLAEGGELRRVLEDAGLLEPVTAILARRPHPEVEPWMAEVVSSTVDADMLDYLRRDAYFCGLRHTYDDRVFGLFTLADGHLAVRLYRHGVERRDVRSEVLHLLRLRAFLTERVYLHHTKVAAGAMVAKAVERALARGELAEPDLYGLTDAGLLARLQASADPAAARLARGVAERRLLKRAYVLSSPPLSREEREDLVRRLAGPANRAARAALERELAAEAGVPEGMVVVHCPERSMFKEVGVRVTARDGVRRLDELDEPLAEEVRALARQYEDLWRLYVFAPAEARDAVGGACRRLLGWPSTYARGG